MWAQTWCRAVAYRIRMVICSSTWCTSGTLHTPIIRSPVNFSSPTCGRDATRRGVSSDISNLWKRRSPFPVWKFVTDGRVFRMKKERGVLSQASRRRELRNYKLGDVQSRERYRVPASRVTRDEKSLFAVLFLHEERAYISHPRVPHGNISNITN